jgi:S1-C subfamily serine protease
VTVVRLGVASFALAGAAAAVALAVRDPLAKRVLRAIDVHDLAEHAAMLAPRTTATPAPTPPPVALPPAPPAVSIAPPRVAMAKTNKTEKAKATTFEVTRAELEDAVAKRGFGAQATVVRDDAGAPLGLALHRVGAFARFGVAEGDLLVSANGLPLRTGDEALAALGKLGESRAITVVLRRGDRSYAVPITLVGE